MKEILKQMGPLTRAHIAAMMPTRALYHVACKALEVPVRKWVENMQYTSKELVDDDEFHFIEGDTDVALPRFHRIDGPAKCSPFHHQYWVDGMFLDCPYQYEEGLIQRLIVFQLEFLENFGRTSSKLQRSVCEMQYKRLLLWKEHLDQLAREKREREESERAYEEALIAKRVRIE